MRPIPPGTHLVTPRAGGLYNHHGVTAGWIVEGVGPVGHFSGDVRKDVASARIRVTSLEEFADGYPVFAEPHERLPFTSQEIVRRLVRRLGERGYNLASRNCEHVIRWLLTGEWRSRQVQRVQANLGIPAFAAAGAAGSIAIVKAMGGPHTGAARLMAGLGKLGGPFSLGPAGTVAALGLIPVAAAGPVVSWWYADDRHAPALEREARAAARRVATPVALGTAVGVTAWISAAGVPGLSAVGITTGLKAIGSILGGGMGLGSLLALLTPVGVAAVAAALVYRGAKVVLPPRRQPLFVP